MKPETATGHKFDTPIGTIYVDYDPYCIGCQRYEPQAHTTCKTDANGRVILAKDYSTIIDGVSVVCSHRYLCQHVAHELADRFKGEHNG